MKTNEKIYDQFDLADLFDVLIDHRDAIRESTRSGFVLLKHHQIFSFIHKDAITLLMEEMINHTIDILTIAMGRNLTNMNRIELNDMREAATKTLEDISDISKEIERWDA